MTRGTKYNSMLQSKNILKYLHIYLPNFTYPVFLMQATNHDIHNDCLPNFLKYLMVAITTTKDHETRSLRDKVRPAKLAICPVRLLSF